MNPGKSRRNKNMDFHRSGLFLRTVNKPRCFVPRPEEQRPGPEEDYLAGRQAQMQFVGPIGALSREVCSNMRSDGQWEEHFSFLRPNTVSDAWNIWQAHIGH